MTDLPPIQFPSSGLALVPEQTDAPASASPPKANFQADTRNKVKCERRQNGERRETIRFQLDRRSGQDRRPCKPSWEQTRGL